LLLAFTGGGGAAYYFYAPQTPVAPTRPPPALDAPPAAAGKTPDSATPAQSRTTAAEKIRSFVEHYDGGNCFFLTPVAIGERSALIEGLGSSDGPFMAFDKEFQRTMGFDPDIRVLQVAGRQCPAIAFLARLRGGNARAPRLDINQESLRGGQALNGMVDRYGTRIVDLILVSDTGAVKNVSSQLKSGTDAKTFNIEMPGSEGTAGRQPQLLIAVASSAPIDAIQLRQPAEAEQFFPSVLSDAARSGKSLSAVARYFMLER
jgi:serine/threonine-protein kinase